MDPLAFKFWASQGVLGVLLLIALFVIRKLYQDLDKLRERYIEKFMDLIKTQQETLIQIGEYLGSTKKNKRSRDES